MTPSGVRLPGVSIIFSSVTATSLTRRPPPLIPGARIAVRRSQGCVHKRARARRVLHLGARDLHGRQVLGQRAFLEGLACRVGGVVGRGAAVHQRGRWSILQRLLGLDADLEPGERPGDPISPSGSLVNSLRKRATSPSSVLRYINEVTKKYRNNKESGTKAF